MEVKSGAKMLLADQRELFESSINRSFSTFSSKNCYNDDRNQFHSLFLLNDELLAANSSIEFHVVRNSYQIFIPLRGELTIQRAAETWNVDVEEVAILPCSHGAKLRLTNGYEADWISFIHLAIDISFTDVTAEFKKLNFSFGATGLITFRHADPEIYPFKISIGRFDGRQEDLYAIPRADSEVFCFVLNGAFEVNGCLLHARDGLALWNVSNVEMEALSNHAVMLLLEA